jgi:rhamnulokinase
MAKKTVLAIDLGASAGRVVAVHLDGSDLSYEELHRFPNEPVRSPGGTLEWDISRLWREIQAGIGRGKAFHPASIGVDTWGVDFGLLDEDDELVSTPVHYRDARTSGMMEAVFARVPRAEVFNITGIQIMPINTLYQMMSLVVNRLPDLEKAVTFLTIPDLLNYWLTGVKVVEHSNATTTQMLDARSGEWATGMLEKLGFPTRIFPEIVQSGTRLGTYRGIPVIAPACHDTGSAVAAVPASDENFCYISSGTWSLVGVETRHPLIDERVYAANLTNEGGVYGTTRLLKNVMGLWILEQCREAWASQGHEYSYDELITLAEAAEPLRSLIDPNDNRFLPPGDHPALIRAYCRESGQPIPETPGQTVRCVLESLALKYREVVETLEEVTGRVIQTIHVVGGGSQNALLCQMTADATGCPVIAGPVEAAVLGNAIVQLITLGEFEDLWEARRGVRAMHAAAPYLPRETATWVNAIRKGS